MQEHNLTAASLAAVVGPALVQVQTSASTGHMGFDIYAAVAFLVKNCFVVFADDPGPTDYKTSAESAQHAAADASLGGRSGEVTARYIAGVATRGRSRGASGADGGPTAPLPPARGQETAQRPRSSRPAAARPQRMDNLLTSVAGAPRRATGGGAADSQKPERSLSGRQRSRLPRSQSPVRPPGMGCMCGCTLPTRFD